MNNEKRKRFIVEVKQFLGPTKATKEETQTVREKRAKLSKDAKAKE